MGFVCILCPRPGFECVKFSNYEFCAPFVSALYDTFIVPWCLLKQMQHDIWLFMGKWVGFGLFVSFKFWHIKGIFISLSSPFQVFIFHNELCGSECNFLHVCEQGRYFALRQTPFWSDVVMFEELTNNVDSIRRRMTYNLCGSFENQRLLYRAMHVFFCFCFFISILQFVHVCLLPHFWVAVCKCVSVCGDDWEILHLCVWKCVCV